MASAQIGGNTLIDLVGRCSMTGRKSSRDKVDLYQEHKGEYAASQEPAMVKVGPALYLVAAGQGSPGGPEFLSAMGSLFGAAYTLKFLFKAQGRDFKVSGPEGLWANPTTGHAIRMEDLAKLPWRLMIRVPEFVRKTDLTAALQRLAEKGKSGHDEVTLERIREGTCVQMLHIGPYSEEWRTVQSMVDLSRERGLSVVGPHHEIYLSDPRRVSPARLKTILRLGVKKARPRS